MKLSVGIITYNEENRVGKTLDSVREIADEIIVVDSESSDSGNCKVQRSRSFC